MEITGKANIIGAASHATLRITGQLCAPHTGRRQQITEQSCPAAHRDDAQPAAEKTASGYQRGWNTLLRGGPEEITADSLAWLLCCYTECSSPAQLYPDWKRQHCHTRYSHPLPKRDSVTSTALISATTRHLLARARMCGQAALSPKQLTWKDWYKQKDFGERGHTAP